MESFNTLYEAQIMINDWRLEYNHYRPHQSLNYPNPPPNTPAAGKRKTKPDSHNHWTKPGLVNPISLQSQCNSRATTELPATVQRM